MNPENREPLKEMRLGSGELVLDKPDSHLHDNVKTLIDEVLAKVSSNNRNLIQEEVDFGRVVGERALVETGSDDTIVYAQRPNRKGLTRFAKKSRDRALLFCNCCLKKKQTRTWTRK